MEITEFLAARLDEDEALARAAAWMDSPRYPNVTPMAEWTYQGDGFEVEPGVTHDYEGLSPAVDPEQGPHIARWDPARVLAEVAAKRAVVAMHPAEGAECGQCSFHELYEGFNDVSEAWPCPTLRLLTQVYATHKDYNPDWRP